MGGQLYLMATSLKALQYIAQDITWTMLRRNLFWKPSSFLWMSPMHDIEAFFWLR